MSGRPFTEQVLKHGRKRKPVEPRWPLGPVGNAIGTLGFMALLVFLHVATFKGNSPLDRGTNSYWQPNMPGQSWILLLVFDVIILMAGYHWLRKRMQSRSPK